MVINNRLIKLKFELEKREKKKLKALYIIQHFFFKRKMVIIKKFRIHLLIKSQKKNCLDKFYCSNLIKQIQLGINSFPSLFKFREVFYKIKLIGRIHFKIEPFPFKIQKTDFQNILTFFCSSSLPFFPIYVRD